VKITAMTRRASPSELIAWTLLGGAIGVVAGFALGEWLGPFDRRRAGRALKAPFGGDSGPRLRAAETARMAWLALQRDLEIKDLGLEPVAVGPGVVELHGWVPSRALRTRAARLVAATDGIDTLINCVLVRGEDDAADAREAADQPA
jgi:hypothetical protein